MERDLRRSDGGRAMTDATALDRRRLLQAGLAAAALSVPVVRGGPGRTSGLTAPGSLPTIADWEAVLGTS